MSFRTGDNDATDLVDSTLDSESLPSAPTVPLLQHTSSVHIPIGRVPHSPGKKARSIETLSGQSAFASHLHSIFVTILHGPESIWSVDEHPLSTPPSLGSAPRTRPWTVRVGDGTTSVRRHSQSPTLESRHSSWSSQSSRAGGGVRAPAWGTSEHPNTTPTTAITSGNTSACPSNDTREPQSPSTTMASNATFSDEGKFAPIKVAAAFADTTATPSKEQVSPADGDGGRRGWSRLTSAASLWSMSSEDSASSSTRRCVSGLASIGSSVRSSSPRLTRSPITIPGIVDCFFDLVALSPAKPTSYSHVARQVIHEAREVCIVCRA